MPLGLGLAVSNSPLLFRGRDQWEDIYHRLIGDVPQDNRAEVETPEMLDSYEQRVNAGFNKLSELLGAYNPSALVMVLSDTGRVFADTHVPQLAVQTGEDIWGTTHYSDLGESASEEHKVTLKINQDVARWLVDELTEEGFDMNISRFFKPLGDEENGAPQAMLNAYERIAGAHNIPVVPLFVNAYKDPAIKGHRLPALGRAIHSVLEERDEKIAILAVGGLSGDPHGYLAGWVDELLDNWILSRLRRGRSQQLETLWDVESITLRGATREVRNWIITGAAMEAGGAKATIVDYIRFHHATVGTAFAYWQPK